MLTIPIREKIKPNVKTNLLLILHHPFCIVYVLSCHLWLLEVVFPLTFETKCSCLFGPWSLTLIVKDHFRLHLGEVCSAGVPETLINDSIISFDSFSE